MKSETVIEMGSSRRMRGLDRAFEILSFLRERGSPARPNEIAIGIESPKSTAYELINLLIKRGILEYADGDGRVFLGRKLYFLGLAYQEHFDLTRECRPFLHRIATVTGETAQLCMLDGNKYTVAMTREGERPFRINSDVGEHIPLPWTASGRFLVSDMSDDEILSFIPADDFRLPDGTLLDTKVFLDEVHTARADGFFSFDTLVDNFTHCFAAPIYQDGAICAATLCIIAPREDALKRYGHYREALVSAARELSDRLHDAPLTLAAER